MASAAKNRYKFPMKPTLDALDRHPSFQLRISPCSSLPSTSGFANERGGWTHSKKGKKDWPTKHLPHVIAFLNTTTDFEGHDEEKTVGDETGKWNGADGQRFLMSSSWTKRQSWQYHLQDICYKFHFFYETRARRRIYLLFVLCRLLLGVLLVRVPLLLRVLSLW